MGQILIGIASIITSVGTIFAVILAMRSFILAKKSLEIAKQSLFADHERRKKQATIEFYDRINKNATAPLRRAIDELMNFPAGENNYAPLNPDNPKIKGNFDFHFILVHYCRHMERFAVGIKLNVYDFQTFYFLSGEPTRKLYEQIRPLIFGKRTIEYALNEYKNLCDRLLEDHKKHQDSKTTNYNSNLPKE